MADLPRIRGLEPEQERLSAQTLRDTRTVGQKTQDFLSSRENLALLMVLCAMAIFSFPALLEPVLLFALGTYWIGFQWARREVLPLRLPQSAQQTDYNDPNPGRRGFARARGIFHLGNRQKDNAELWINRNDALTHFLVFGTTGSGKALPVDARVHTPAGWRRMGDLRVGDWVSTPDGAAGRVDGVFPQGHRPVYQLTFADGRTCDASPDHLWEVHHKHWNGKYHAGQPRVGQARPRVMSTQELMDLMARNRGVFSLRLPAPVEKPAADLPLDPYLLGLLLGDGNLVSNTLRFSTADDEILASVAALLPAGQILERYASHRTYDYGFRQPPGGPRGRLPDGSYARMPLRRALDDLQLFGCRSHEKFIPERYLEASVAQRVALLQGLMDSDGTVSGNSLSFASASLQLARGVQELVWSLGGVAKLSQRQPHYTYQGVRKAGRTSYRVSIRLPDPGMAFRLARKRARLGRYQYADSLKLAVTRIEPQPRDAEMVCIHVDHPEHLFITDQYVVTHNTEFLVSLAWNYLSMGAGLIYVDAKAAPKLPVQIMQMARAVGRTDDVVLVNYTTGNQTLKRRDPSRLSNTTNPFSFGSAESLTQLLVALIPTSSGENALFSERAIGLISTLMISLVELRDMGEILLSVGTIRDYLTLEQCVKLSKRPDLSERARSSMIAYLKSAGGYDEKKPVDRQPEEVGRQFGFAVAYFTRALSSLTDTYGHIYNTLIGEVDFYDVVINRRILIVMLPALEKAPAELANLGKIVLSAVRNAMSVGLGNKIEGTLDEVLESLPTASNVPTGCICDEYGYIATEGFAVTAAQARGLGFSCTFAGQDYAGFKRGSEGEAEQIVANTKVKIAMSQEDPQTTWQLIKELSGEATVTEASGFNIPQGAINWSYQDIYNASVGRRARVELRDLQQQVEGEFHLFFKGEVIRGAAFYAGPPLPGQDRMRINRFLKIKPPSAAAISARFGDVHALVDRLRGLIQAPEAADAGPAPTPWALCQPFLRDPAIRMDGMERAVAALVEWRDQLHRQADWGADDHALLPLGMPLGRMPVQPDETDAEMAEEDPFGATSIPASAPAAAPDADLSRVAARAAAHADWMESPLPAVLGSESLVREDLVRIEQALGHPAPAEAAQTGMTHLARGMMYPDPPTPVWSAHVEADIEAALQQFINAPGGKHGQ